MQTIQTYRVQAELCIRQADYAKTPKHRMTLLQMAQTWLRMADEAEAINKRLASIERNTEFRRAGIAMA